MAGVREFTQDKFFILPILYMHLLRECLERILVILEEKEYDYVPLSDNISSLDALRAELLYANKCLVTVARRQVGLSSKKPRDFPDGNFYMLTVTSLPTEDLEAIKDKYDKTVLFLADKDFSVCHAVIEKSNIFHFHAVVHSTKLKLNLERDLTKFLGVIVKINRVADTNKLFNGLCKYVLKREYLEKGHTYISTLKEGISYKKGQGYKINILK